MKNRIKILTVTAAIIAGLSFNAAFAGGIACVDVQKVVSASSQVQALKKEQQKKTKDLIAFIEKARKDVAAVSDTKKKQALEEKYNKELVAKKEKMDKEYASKLKSIEDSISKVIAEQAKAKGYDMVITKGIVLYGGNDITSDIIKAVK